MVTTYIRFTEEQKDQARRTDLRSFLLGQGEKVERSGSEYKWNHGGEKITIRGNLWFNQYEPDSGGGDAIAFVREFYGLDFPEAVQFLLKQQGVAILPQKNIPENEKKPFALPKKNEDMRRVYAYLLKARFLDREIVNAFVRSGLIFLFFCKVNIGCHHESSFLSPVSNHEPVSFHQSCALTFCRSRPYRLCARPRSGSG